MNETLKVMETRRSCRNFDKKKMVSAEDIEAIVFSCSCVFFGVKICKKEYVKLL